MMTPSEVKEYEFKSSGRNAYNADDVDEFLAIVAADYEKMFRENGELVKRASLLADRLAEVRKDEDDIKQAVLSAQRAADIIVRDAEESAANAKKEADEVLAAAKGEADIIKADAEKQAAADSETLLALARDKATEIINKAKEEAGDILSDAKSSAEDKVGAATRTVTSETLYFDMLKKEVADFRASILAQYKSHIEMISKLPELAEEKVAEQNEAVEDAKREQAVAAVIEDAAADVAEEAFEPEITFVNEDETEEEAEDEPVAEESDANAANDVFSGDEEPAVTFLTEEKAEEEPQWNVTATAAAEVPDDEDVVKTELPSEYFSENTSLEFVADDATDAEETVEETGGFHLDLAGLDFGGADFGEDDGESAPEEADGASFDAEANDAEPSDEEEDSFDEDADGEEADDEDASDYEDDVHEEADGDESEDDEDDFRSDDDEVHAPPFPKHEFERIETTEPEDNSPRFRFGLFHKKK